MIEAFQIGVSLAVDTDEAHAALAGFGRQLSSLDQSIAQTHRRMADMRAAVSMPDDISGSARLSELSQSFARRDSLSPAASGDVEGNRSPIRLMTAHDTDIGVGSLEEIGQRLPRPALRPHSDTADVSDLRSLMDVMGAADRARVVQGLPWSGRSDEGLAAPEEAAEWVEGPPPQLNNTTIASPTWHEDFALRHVPETVGEDVAAPTGGLAAFDLSSFLPRLGDTLGVLGAPGTSSDGDVEDAAVPNSMLMAAWPFDRALAEVGVPSGAVIDQVTPPDIAASANLSALDGLPLALPAGFSQERLAGYPGAPDQVGEDTNWSPAASLSADKDPASVAPGQGLEATFTDALSWLGSSSAAAAMSPNFMERLGDRHSDLMLRDDPFAMGLAASGGGGRHPGVASGARGLSGEGEVTFADGPAEPPALPFGLPLLPRALWEPGEGERQAIAPSLPRRGDGFIGIPSGNAEMAAMKQTLAAPLPPVFANTGSPSTHASDEAGGPAKGRQTSSTDERGDNGGERPIVVHTNVQIDGDVVARAVTHRMVATLNGPLAGIGGFDPRRSYTPVES